MNYSKILEELFLQQEEYLGNNKLVNNIIPTVSVHVITYQHVNYIEDCLRGILMQKTNFPIEIVIGEDESEDGTREICKKYAEEYPNKIRLFLRDRNKSVLKENGHTIYFNGKLTLKSCRGKYIAICEGDDYWTDPYKLQKQVDFLETNSDYGLIHTNYSVFNDFRDKMIINHNRFKKIPEGEIFEKLILNNTIATLTVLVRKELVFRAMDAIEKRKKVWLMGDYPLWLFISRYYKIGYIKTVTSVYRKRTGSAQQFDNYEKRIQFIKSTWDIQKYFFHKYEGIIDECLYYKAIMNLYIKMVKYTFLLNDLEKTKKSYKKIVTICKRKNIYPSKKNILIIFIVLFLSKNMLVRSFVIKAYALIF